MNNEEAKKYIENVQRSNREFNERQQRFKQTLNETRRKELAKNGIKMIDTEDTKSNFHGNCDSVYSLENGPATVLYAIVMIGGLIFKDWWLIWITASIIYFKFITRHD